MTAVTASSQPVSGGGGGMRSVLAQATFISASAISPIVDEELSDIRNRIVAIASRRRISIGEIISLGIVFTKEELISAAATGSLNADVMVSMVPAAAQGSASGNNEGASIGRLSASSEGNARKSTRTDADINQLRHRILPPGHQLRPGLPPDADDAWVEDEERRQSIPMQLKKDFATTIKASAASVVESSTKDGPQRNRTAWNMATTRAFGVEMETCLAKRSDEFLMDNAIKAIRDVVPNLRTFLGSDFEVGFVDYQTAKDDRAYKMWKITTDLSIKSEDGRPIFGLEFITPKLGGPYDLWRVEHFCEQLQAMNFSVNTTTALHVHVSVEDLSNYEIMRVCQYCVVYEAVFDSFMTLPRRSDYSRYCRSNLRSVSTSRSVTEALTILSNLKLDRSIAPLIRAFCPRLSAVRNSHRNHKINLLLLNRTRQGTPGRRIEFRQHQGSVDKVEVGAWVTLITKWVEKVAKMPPPNATDGTVDKFWSIVDDVKLRAYYTVKAQTLPSSMTFTYDSRELYAYDSDEEEQSDIDDSTPPETPQQHPRSTALPSSPPPPVQVTSATPPPAQGSRVGFIPSPPTITRAEVPSFERGDAFASPPVSRSSSAHNQAAQDDTSSSTDAFAALKTVTSDNANDNVRLGVRPWEGGDMSMSSLSQEPVIHTVHKQMKRQRPTLNVGNFVLPLPLHVEALVTAEAGDTWDKVVSSDTDIVCAEVEDANDNTSWYVTAPTGRLLTTGSQLISRRRHDGGTIRWISPWLLEAKKLETISIVVDMIKESLLVEDRFVSLVSINVSGLTNLEVAMIVGGILVFEPSLGALLGDPVQEVPRKDSKVFAKLVAEIIKLGSTSAQSPFPRNIQLITQKILATSFFDMQDVTETSQTSRGNFSLRRALRFSIVSTSIADLVHRCIFLSYMCNHFGKRCKDSELVKCAEMSVSPSKRDLLEFISSVPGSVQRCLGV